jgi:PadR family transcriptional regulator PadR
MRAPFTARAAVLQALESPGHGLELIRRVEMRTGGRVRLKQGSVYPALRQLEREGLVRAWKGRPAKSGGRPRRYYELTLKGVEVASELRTAIGGLVQAAPPPRPSPREIEQMQDRLRRCAAVSAFCMDLRRAYLEACRR